MLARSRPRFTLFHSCQRELRAPRSREMLMLKCGPSFHLPSHQFILLLFSGICVERAALTIYQPASALCVFMGGSTSNILCKYLKSWTIGHACVMQSNLYNLFVMKRMLREDEVCCKNYIASDVLLGFSYLKYNF